MKPLYIFDLDGTLANIEHRRRFVDRPKKEQDWSSFYQACDRDYPNGPVIAIMESLRHNGGEIWIFSGRSDEVREKTVDWLCEKTSFLHHELESALMMRKAGDFTADDSLKQQWLDEMLPLDRKRLVAVFDDRKRVVDMWRRNGVACMQVAEGEF